MSRPTARPRSTPRQERGKQTELALLQATTWLLSERGFHGTGIRDIADAAGIAISGMYYYAKSKEELLEEIMRRSLVVLSDSARQATAAQTDAATRLTTIIGTHVLFHTRNPRSARVTDQDFGALTGTARKRVLELRDGYEAMWADILADGVAQGWFVDRGPVARLALLQMTTGVAQWYKPRGPLTAEEVWHQFATMALAMLDPGTGRRRLTVDSLDLPPASGLKALVQLSTEPRRRPPGLSTTS